MSVKTGQAQDTIFLTLWTLASPEVYDAAIDRAGCTHAGPEHWLSTALMAALTLPPQPPPATGGTCPNSDQTPQ